MKRYTWAPSYRFSRFPGDQEDVLVRADIVDAKGGIVGGVTISRDGYALDEAEIRRRTELLAAAPDLLTAAKTALATAENWIRDQLDGTSKLDAELAALEPVRAAVAKAEGRQP